MTRSISVWVVSTACAVLLAACGAEGGGAGPAAPDPEIEGGLPVVIEADAATAWTVTCRFRPVKIDGGTFNSRTFEGTGPQTTGLPGQNGRCTVTKTSGEGPVTLRLRPQDKPEVVVSVAEAGQSAPANVFE